MHRIIALAAVSLTIASCGASDNDPGPGAVTVGEARALDEAAEMLDERRMPAEVMEESPVTDIPATDIPATGIPAGDTSASASS